MYVLRATCESAGNSWAKAAKQERCYDMRDPLARANQNSPLSRRIFSDCFMDYFTCLSCIDLTQTDKTRKRTDSKQLPDRDCWQLKVNQHYCEKKGDLLSFTWWYTYVQRKQFFLLKLRLCSRQRMFLHMFSRAIYHSSGQGVSLLHCCFQLCCCTKKLGCFFLIVVVFRRD